MTYIPMQEGQKDIINLLEKATRQLKAVLMCLSSMSNLNIKEEDVT